MDDISDASLQLSGSLSGKACQDLVNSSLDMSSELLDKIFEHRTLSFEAKKTGQTEKSSTPLRFHPRQNKVLHKCMKDRIINILAFRR